MDSIHGLVAKTGFFGRKIETVVEGEQTVDTYEILYSVKNLPSGMYIYTLRLDNNVLGVRKMIKQ